MIINRCKKSPIHTTHDVVYVRQVASHPAPLSLHKNSGTRSCVICGRISYKKLNVVVQLSDQPTTSHVERSMATLLNVADWTAVLAPSAQFGKRTGEWLAITLISFSLPLSTVNRFTTYLNRLGCHSLSYIYMTRADARRKSQEAEWC